MRQSDKKELLAVVAVDEAEAMVRFLEAFAGFTRPPGIDARDLLDILGKGGVDAVKPSDLRAIRAGVQRILAYVFEQLETGFNADVDVNRVPGSQVPRRRH